MISPLPAFKRNWKSPEEALNSPNFPAIIPSNRSHRTDTTSTVRPKADGPASDATSCEPMAATGKLAHPPWPAIGQPVFAEGYISYRTGRSTETIAASVASFGDDVIVVFGLSFLGGIARLRAGRPGWRR